MPVTTGPNTGNITPMLFDQLLAELHDFAYHVPVIFFFQLWLIKQRCVRAQTVTGEVVS